MSETQEKKSRGRPKGSTNKRKPSSAGTVVRKSLKDMSPRKVCSCCKKTLATTNYYKSFSNLSADGFSNFCKKCTFDACLDERGRLDTEKLRSVLQQMDRPFLPPVLDAAVSEYENKHVPAAAGGPGEEKIIQLYMKNIGSLPQYSAMNYSQGVEYMRTKVAGTDKVAEPIATPPTLPDYLQDEEPIFLEDEDADFVVTREIVQKFGQGYTKSDYAAMVRKYQFLSQSYPELTNLHVEGLCNYVRFKVLAEKATSMGRLEEAERWEAMATKAADKAKLNPSQLSQSDLQGGLNSFSELLMAVEQAVDIIPILPQFRYRPNDAVDFTIWCYINYARKLEGKPTVEYKDIYKFYDQRKEEYIAQYGDPHGIFDDDPTEENRDKIKKFITMPKSIGDENE